MRACSRESPAPRDLSGCAELKTTTLACQGRKFDREPFRKNPHAAEKNLSKPSGAIVQASVVARSARGANRAFSATAVERPPARRELPSLLRRQGRRTQPYAARAAHRISPSTSFTASMLGRAMARAFPPPRPARCRHRRERRSIGGISARIGPSLATVRSASALLKSSRTGSRRSAANTALVSSPSAARISQPDRPPPAAPLQL